METWDWAGEDRGEEELHELAPEEPRPSRISFLALPLLTWSQVWEAYESLLVYPDPDLDSFLLSVSGMADLAPARVIPVLEVLCVYSEYREQEQLAPDTEPSPMFRFHAVWGESQPESGCLLEPRDTCEHWE